MFKSRRIKEEEPRRDEPETEERSAAKKVSGSTSNVVQFVSPKMEQNLQNFLTENFIKFGEEIFSRNLANILLRVNFKKFPFLSLLILKKSEAFVLVHGWTTIIFQFFFLVFVPADLANSRPISYIL
jgi:hypothetical protein